MGSGMEELQTQLIDEYSQSIETSTLLAILSDYNLTNATELSAAREILDILKSSASAEESSGFDPSGASGPQHVFDGLEQGSVRDAEENESLSTSQRGSKTHTDDTSFSQDSYPLSLEGLELGGGSRNVEREEGTGKTYSSELDNLDGAGKEEALIAIFPALKPFDIKWTLKKCKGDAGLAIDELMTQAFLEESGTRHRGIEAFSENDAVPRQRKGRGKKKKGNGSARNAGSASNASSSTSPVESPTESKWDTGRQDIEFISGRTGIPVPQLSTMYHKNGGTARGTIAAIVKAHAEMGIYEDDPVVQINAYDLHQEFPSISMADLQVLLHITQPSLSDARDLARALTTPTNAKTGGIQIDIRHAPIQLDPEPIPVRKPLNTLYRDDALPSFASASASAASLTTSRNTAFTQASSAYRKGKSNPLMGGAAAYYSSVGRDFDARAKAASSAAVDAFVSQQRDLGRKLDLHGMNVKDAVRVSRECVTRWWVANGGGERGGRGVGVYGSYEIVTGRGNHSTGGGKLGPAVAKMLMQEGWRIQVGSGGNTGIVLVLGVVRKK
ncbi:hypothetical protein VTL71DRAFT_14229 [Oculimacula yallundae]|uniref:Smr domain-containing protein n=1 Tax=Oculimacula yallundae TaxID=86028 RepID=A0ABR4CIJ4_9HELO